MDALTLEEQLFLLSRDPVSGRDQSLFGIDTPLAGAVLIALVKSGAVTVEDDRVVPRDNGTLLSPHLQAALNLIVAEGRVRKSWYWLSRLPSHLKLQEQVGLSLVERAILRDERGRLLGFKLRRFPQVEPVSREAIQAQVVAALIGTDPAPSPDTKVLVGLLESAGLVSGLVDRPRRRQARLRAKAFVDEAPICRAVFRAVSVAQQSPRARLAIHGREALSQCFVGGGGGAR